MEGIFIADLDAMIVPDDTAFEGVKIDKYALVDAERMYRIFYDDRSFDDIEAHNAADALEKSGRDDVVRILAKKFLHHVPVINAESVTDTGDNLMYHAEHLAHDVTKADLSKCKNGQQFEMLSYQDYSDVKRPTLAREVLDEITDEHAVLSGDEAVTLPISAS